MKKEKQQKRPKRTKAQRVQALKTFAVDTGSEVTICIRAFPKIPTSGK